MQVYEVFYSRVEAPYSLRRKSGYQVVYHSPTLNDGIVREVENHLRCFDSGNVDIRYQYFHLSSGDVALAMCQRIDEINSQITDRAGRSGPFVGHCLIVNRDDFAAVDNNPFLFFDSPDYFVLEVDDMVKRQQAQPEFRELKMPTEANLEFDYYRFDIEDWKKEDFTLLWYAASEAEDIVKQKKALTIQAEDENAIYDLLALLHFHLTPDLRYACTFNTFVDGCNPQGGTYWSMGGFRKVKLPGAFQVRLDRCTINFRPTTSNVQIKELAETVYQKLKEAQDQEEDEE